MCMIKICISVTSHALDTPLSQAVTPSRTPLPLERDVLYGRPHRMDRPITKTLMKVMFITSVKSGMSFQFFRGGRTQTFPNAKKFNFSEQISE